MLTSLSIRNYALIKQLEIAPSGGLNILTGETGAGKSIVLGAVGLLLGKRADTKVLFSSDSKCVIEGEFDITNYDLQSIFEENDLDYEEQTIIRREINTNGKSRSFINDIPTTLDVLRGIGIKLLDIHSQNESIRIADKLVRLDLVDAYAGTRSKKSEFGRAFEAFKSKEKELNQLIELRDNLSAEKDYKQFLFEELDNANLQKDEERQLEEEIQVLENSEDIKLKLSQVVGEYSESEFSLSDRLKELQQALRSVSTFSDKIQSQEQRFSSALEELNDIAMEIADIKDSVEYDPERIEEVNGRLNLLQNLYQKHKVSDVESLIKAKEKLESEIGKNEDVESRIDLISTELVRIQDKLVAQANRLSKERNKVLKTFSGQINELLPHVGIPDGQVIIQSKEVSMTASGIDEIEFLFTANKGVSPQPLEKVASGGEFSRLMLCLKFLMAKKTSLPTVIFDEIDTGVSGEIAKKMATMMKRMSQEHQVIAISHLPQIAAKGDSHYFVYKNSNGATAESLIRKLDQQDHLNEIAKMIGGNNPSDAALKNAKELIEN